MTINIRDILFTLFLIFLVSTVGLISYMIIKGNNTYYNEFKILCEEKGFTWIERQDGALVNDCYEINDGIIQFYNLYEINGTKYLMKGTK